jgi:hypothetical protein
LPKIVLEKRSLTEEFIPKIRNFKIAYGITNVNLLLSPNAQYVGVFFIKIKDRTLYIQINDKIYGPYDWTYPPIFSNDGSKYGWWFEKDQKQYIQINDKTYGPYDTAHDPRFSHDGSKYGWRFSKDNKYYIQINNKTYGPYDNAFPLFSLMMARNMDGYLGKKNITIFK